MQIMKKLFFSLILGTIIAICWVMIIHTLKWIAIKGNEFELIQQQQAHDHKLAAAAAAAAASDSITNFRPQADQLGTASPFDRLSGAGQLALSSPPPPRLEPSEGAAESGLAKRFLDDFDGDSDDSGTGQPVAEMSIEQQDPKQQAARRRERVQQANSNNNVPRRIKIAQSDWTKSTPASGAPAMLDAAPYNEETTLKSETPETSPATNSLVAELANGWPSSGPSSSRIPEAVASNNPNQPHSELMFRAPFFTSWFVSIWNLLFMPVFGLISSCCFRGEDSSTKKLLV